MTPPPSPPDTRADVATPRPTRLNTVQASAGDDSAFPKRLVILGALLATAWAGVLVKAAHEQLIGHRHWRERAQQQQARRSALPPSRGKIVDRDGIALARSADAVRLALDPRALRDTARAFRALAPLGADTGAFRRGLQRGDRWMPLPYPILFADAASAASVRGVATQRTAVRLVDASLPSLRALIGHARDSIGLDGIERARNRQLAGRPGHALVYRSASGQPLSDTITVQPPRGGYTIELTISRDVQGIVESTLDDAMRTYGATGGDILILDIPSGEILGLAGRRSNQPVGATLLTEPFEPGSTIKPLLVGLALEAGVTTPDEWINTYGGRWSYLGRPIVDVHKGGMMTVREVLSNSSNIGMSQLMLRMPPDELYAGLKRAGLGARLQLGVGPETRGVLHPTAAWSAQSRPSLAMGYEVSTTLLHMATIYAALASDGVRRQPALVRRVYDESGNLIESHIPTIRDTILRARTARTIQRIMLATVDSGTGALAKVRDLPIAGKTGTARQARVGGRGYDQRYLASFIGYVPADAPRFVVAVRLDNPTAMYGGATAAPVAKRVIEALLSSTGAQDALPDILAAQERTRQQRRGANTSTSPPASITRNPARTSPQGATQASTTLANMIRHWRDVVYPPTTTAKPAAGRPGPAERDSVTIPTMDSTATTRDHLRALGAVDLRARPRFDMPFGTSLPAAGVLMPKGGTVDLGVRPPLWRQRNRP